MPASLDTVPAQALRRSIPPAVLLKDASARAEVARRIVSVIKRAPSSVPDPVPELQALADGEIDALVTAVTALPKEPGRWQQARFDLRMSLALWGLVHQEHGSGPKSESGRGSGAPTSVWRSNGCVTESPTIGFRCWPIVSLPAAPAGGCRGRTRPGGADLCVLAPPMLRSDGLQGPPSAHGETRDTIANLERQLSGGLATVTPEKIEKFGRLLADNLCNGPPPFRKAYMRLLIERIELDDDEVRIIGPIGQLERALETKDFQAMPAAPSSVREWRPGRDSNP